MKNKTKEKLKGKSEKWNELCANHKDLKNLKDTDEVDASFLLGLEDIDSIDKLVATVDSDLIEVEELYELSHAILVEYEEELLLKNPGNNSFSLCKNILADWINDEATDEEFDACWPYADNSKNPDLFTRKIIIEISRATNGSCFDTIKEELETILGE